MVLRNLTLVYICEAVLHNDTHLPKCKHPLAKERVLTFEIDDKKYWLSIAKVGTSLGFEYYDAIGFGSFSITNS